MFSQNNQTENAEEEEYAYRDSIFVTPEYMHQWTISWIPDMDQITAVTTGL